MRLVSSALRLAGAVVLFAGLSLVAGHAHVRADDALPEPFDTSAIDRTASACANFFDFATGAYREAHPIPAAYSEYGYTEALIDQTRDIVRTTLERAENKPGAAGSVTQQIGTLYGSCMDTAAVERAGLRPIAPELARIDALRSRTALTIEIAHLHEIGVDAGFSLSPTQDFQNSSSVIAEIDQSGIGLPERDYYLRSDAASRTLRGQYVTHVQRILALAGDATAARDAMAILAFETTLARGSLPAATLRDPAAVYHPLRAPAVAALAPHFAFARYFRATGVPATGIINVAEPIFVRTFDAQLAAVALSTWRAYLRWRLLDAYATVLPRRFDAENFAFRGRLLDGTTAQLPRWKRCVEVTNTYLGMAVGQAYVASAFSPAAKQRALDMTLRIKRAYRAELAALSWMTPTTKRYALAKLDAMGLKVGYPDRWRSYVGYVLTPGTYFANVERGRVYDHAHQVHKIGRPLDRSEWDMTPQTVNAYDDIQRNEIVLPAAQLQRPFFDPAADDAANIGATGAGTVGHEMTHGFDDEGHKFDLHGNVHNWWTATDLAQFDARAACVIHQFDDTIAVGDVHYQGKLDAGEAIADFGGVVIGYRALEDSLGTGPRTKVDGFTPEQRYFLAFAQSWAESVRPEAARTQALTDPHPLPRDRVNNTVANVPGWYTAFNCPKPPRPLCSVW
jgi:predicted metalloendopeptidase